MFKKFMLSIMFLFMFTTLTANALWFRDSDVENLITMRIRKVVNVGDLQVKVFSEDKAKKVSLEAKNINAKNIYLSSVKIKSLTPITNVEYKDKKIIPTSPMSLAYSCCLKIEDLQKTLALNEIRLKNLKMKTVLNNVISFDLLNPSIAIEDEKAVFNADLHFAGMPVFFNFPVTIESGLAVKNDKIILDGFRVMNIDPQFFSLDKDNKEYVIYDLKKLEQNDNVIVKITSLTIKGDKINLEGDVTIPAYSPKYSLKME